MGAVFRRFKAQGGVISVGQDAVRKGKPPAPAVRHLPVGFPAGSSGRTISFQVHGVQLVSDLVSITCNSVLFMAFEAKWLRMLTLC